MGFRGGGSPSVYWFSSTPAEIGLKANVKTKQINYLKLFERAGRNDSSFYWTKDFAEISILLDDEKTNKIDGKLAIILKTNKQLFWDG